MAVRQHVFCKTVKRSTEIPLEEIDTQSYLCLVHWGVATISLQITLLIDYDYVV